MIGGRVREEGRGQGGRDASVREAPRGQEKAEVDEGGYRREGSLQGEEDEEGFKIHSLSGKYVVACFK